MRVLVVGAGMGGLVLAHGLRAAGVEVQVHERDTDLARTGGYRLHLDAAAVGVLRRRLPASVFQAVLASAAHPRSFRQFSVLDHKLRVLARIPRGGDGDHLLIGRIPLRTLLGHGLEDVVRLGSEFTHHVENPDGTVTATFAGGRTETADVLVGADGGRSRVVSALTGAYTARPLRASGLAGRAALDAGVRSGMPRDLLAGPAFVLGPDGTAVFLSMQDPATAAIAAAACRDVAPVIEPAYVLWGVIAPGTVPDSGLRSSAVDSARALLHGWSEWMRTVLDASEASTAAHFPYYAADPDSELCPWQVGSVTALGGAVHAMPPTGGQGAATAIRDADVLATNLLSAAGGATTVPLAIHDYQQAMVGYAVPALRESLQPLRWQRRITGGVGRPLARAVLPVLGATAGLRRAPLAR